MKILHTSDWHLGRSLYGRKRYEEFGLFLNWLLDTIKKEAIDVLLIAGDIFDTSAPSNRSQRLYYQFLCRAAGSCCSHIVITAGNHDSPSFLNAPKELLGFLNVHVIGSIPKEPTDEVIVLRGKNDTPELIVCAVPYLRDRDIRIVEAGETVKEKQNKSIQGVKKHYEEICKIAEEKEKESEQSVPIVAMGHLFAAGGKTADSDGVRELMVGSLFHVSADVFPDCIDYVALGHLHIPQRVGKTAHIRYSGSPIPIGFGENKNEKKTILIEFSGKKPVIDEIAIPCFQPLEKIVGSKDEIVAKIEELKSVGSNAWLEIEYSGSGGSSYNLREIVEETVGNSDMEVRRIKNRTIAERILSQMNNRETLDDLSVEDVFIRCLDADQTPDERRPELILAYKEIVASVYEE